MPGYCDRKLAPTLDEVKLHENAWKTPNGMNGASSRELPHTLTHRPAQRYRFLYEVRRGVSRRDATIDKLERKVIKNRGLRRKPACRGGRRTSRTRRIRVTAVAPLARTSRSFKKDVGRRCLDHYHLSAVFIRTTEIWLRPTPSMACGPNPQVNMLEHWNNYGSQLEAFNVRLDQRMLSVSVPEREPSGIVDNY